MQTQAALKCWITRTVGDFIRKPDVSKAPFDMNMREAMRWKVDKLDRQATPDEMWDVFTDFRDVASQGRLQVWGRPWSISPALGLVSPHEKIPQNFWRMNEFDPTPYIVGNDKDAETGATSWDGRGRISHLAVQKYHDLRVSKENLEAIWGRLPVDDPKPEIAITLHNEPSYEFNLFNANKEKINDTMAYVVRVQNDGHRHLQRCQIKFSRKGDTEYPVSDEFDLRPGEYVDRPIFRYWYGNADTRPFMFFLDKNGHIAAGNGALVIGGSTYEVRVLSASCPPASIHIDIGRRESGWKVTAMMRRC